MKFSILRLPILILALWPAWLVAQQKDEPVYYDVWFQPAVDSGTGGFTFTDGNISTFVGPGDPPTAATKLLPNRDYQASVSGQAGTELHGSVTFSAPSIPGATIWIDGIRQNTFSFVHTSSPDGNFTFTFTFRVTIEKDFPLERAPTHLRGGEASSIVPDKPIWYIGLGNTNTGDSAGAFGFRRQDFAPLLPTDPPDTFFTPAALHVVHTGFAAVERHGPDGALKQVRSTQLLADIQTLSGTSYRIDLYPIGQVTGGGGESDYTFTGSPFITYTLEKIAPSTNEVGVKITRTEDGVAWETRLELETHSPTSGTWTRYDWHRPGATASTVTTVVSGNTATVTLGGPASGLSGDTTHTYTKTYAQYSWGKELTQVVTGGTLVTTYDYYSGTGNGGFIGKLKSQVNPDGSWAKYEYFEAPAGTGYAGAVKRIYRPWLDGPASPDSATTSNSVCEDYTYAFLANQMPASATVTAPGGTLSKSTWSYAFGGAGPLTAVRSDFPAEGAPLVTTTVSELTGLQKPLSVSRPDGSMHSYGYSPGTWNPATLTLSDDPGPDRVERVYHGQTQAGSSSVSMVPDRSTVSTTVRDYRGLPVFVGEYVSTTGGALVRVSGTAYTYDEHGRLTGETDVMRPAAHTQYEYTHSTTGDHPYSVRVTAPDGVVTRYDYDNLMRLVQTVENVNGPSGYPEKIRTTAYDAANRPVAEYSCGCSTAPVRYFYDAAGRLASKREISPNDSAGATQGSLVTSYSYSYSPLPQVTTTLPTGATRVETAYLDGRLLSLAGTAQPPVVYDYTVNATGLLVTKTAGGMTNGWSQAQTDWLGRPVTQSTPAVGWNNDNKIVDVTSTYHATTGTLSRQSTTSRATGARLVADRLYAYDAAGRLTTECLDVDNDGVIDDAGPDRLTKTDQLFVNSDGWHLVAKTEVAATAGSAVLTPVSEVRTRLTDFASGVIGQVVSTDANGRATTRTDSVSSAAKTRTSQIAIAGVNNPAFQSTYHGYDYETQAVSGERTKLAYDTRGRLAQVHSRWNGSAYTATDTYAYNHTNPDTTYIKSLTVAGVTTSYAYAWGGNTRKVTSTTGGFDSYTLYNAMDLPLHVGGAGASATAFGYDAYGRRTSLTTYRGGPYTEANWPGTGGDTTIWTPDPATGLVTRKTYADNNHADYTYNELSQVKTRTWARGTTTTYGYDSGTGELLTQTYSDSTPAVTYTYKRSGLPATVADVTGTRTFAYDSTHPLQLATETLGSFYNNGSTARVRTLKYDTLGRGTGFKLGTSPDDATDLGQTGDFVPATGLLNHLYTASGGGAARTFTYAYKASSSLVDSYYVGANSTANFAMTHDYDGTSAARRSVVQGQYQGVARTRFDLAYDNRGLLQSAKQSGTAFADYYSGASYSSVYNQYAYDERGQVTSAAMSTGTPGSGTPLPGRRFEYRYDGAANRTTAGQTGTAAGGDNEYTVNALNQYTARENNTVRVLGTAPAAATVTATGATVTRTDRNFAADLQPGNTDGPAQGSVTVSATGAGSQSRNWQIARQLQSFAYDADGNLTGDGLWTYQYDAENRLIRMETSSAAVTAGLTHWVLEYKYDAMGRRVQKRSNNVTAGGDVYTRYLYDGWNLVAEFSSSDLQSFSLSRSYTWGLDLAGSLTATGGVGALVQIADHTAGKTYFPTYDGNGNVSSLIDSFDGALAAIYEYSPFGELLRAQTTHAAAAANPFRFSTKFMDVESGLSYYGLRYYSPSLGRFINRDPIEEAGGLNLYAFVANSPVNGVDVLGRYGWWWYLGYDPDDKKPAPAPPPPPPGDEDIRLPPITVYPYPFDADYESWKANIDYVIEDAVRGANDYLKRLASVSFVFDYRLPTFEIKLVGPNGVAPNQTEKDWKPNKKDCDGLNARFGKYLNATSATPFDTADDAAIAALFAVAPMTTRGNVEYGGYVYSQRQYMFFGSTSFYFSSPRTDGLAREVYPRTNLDSWVISLTNRTVVADYHTHPNYDIFSPADKIWAAATGVPLYMFMDDGTAKAFSPGAGSRSYDMGTKKGWSNAGLDIERVPEGAPSKTEYEQVRACQSAGLIK